MLLDLFGEKEMLQSPVPLVLAAEADYRPYCRAPSESRRDPRVADLFCCPLTSRLLAMTSTFRIFRMRRVSAVTAVRTGSLRGRGFPHQSVFFVFALPGPFSS